MEAATGQGSHGRRAAPGERRIPQARRGACGIRARRGRERGPRPAVSSVASEPMSATASPLYWT